MPCFPAALQVRVSNSHTAPDAEVADGSVAVTIGGGGDGKAGEGKEEKPAEDDGHETFSSREYADEYAGEQHASVTSKFARWGGG